MRNWFRNFLGKLFTQRTFVIRIIFIILFVVLVARVFVLQVIKGNKYQENFTLKIQKTRQIASTRGNIYDRNGELLAYNDLAYSVTIEDEGTYDNLSYADRNKALNETIEVLIKIIEKNNDKVTQDFGIILDGEGNYAFEAKTKTARLRFLADVYGYAKTEDLSDDEREASASDVMEYLTGEDRYMLTGVKDKELILKIINIRYLMTQKSYTKYLATTVATDVSKETVAAVNEYKDDYPGIDIVEDSVRRYVDSECFSSVIGYTGTISEDEYADINEEDENKYTKQSVVGKAGVEQVMDSDLQGIPGEETLFVDSVGKVLLTTDVTEPKAGNNVYLSIDKTLQEQAYKVLEREIAGVVLKNLTHDLTYEMPEDADTTAIKIPIGDVYAAFFVNGILNTNDISTAGKKTVQYKTYKKMLKKQDEAIDLITSELKKPTSKRVNYSDEMEDYVSYFLKTFLVSGEILDDNSIDATSDTYKQWSKDQSLTLKDYISFLISENCIDTKELGIEDEYADTDEVIDALIDYSKENMKGSYSLSILCYKYMVKTGAVTGPEVCAMAIEQGVFDDKAEYETFKKGEGDAYAYLVGKISSLQLTPGVLGLEPCSGSVIITDPSTGDVLACVSYPGYDSNKLSNTMDKKYYQQLSLCAAKPLYNHASQEKTAPGSTYKMVTSLAGLDTGCITPKSILSCSGTFRKVMPSPKCWIFPGAHGDLDVVGAITNSCNCFYYQVGYGLSQEDTSIWPIGKELDEIKEELTVDTDGDGVPDAPDPNVVTEEEPVNQYSNMKGLETLKKYASKFGLNEVSGIELPEAKPEISDEDSVRSAIGQGTNNYALTQMSVYVTALANRGVVYNYSIIDHTEDTRGKTIKKYGSTVRHKIKTKSEYWDAIQNGMKEMVANSSQFYNTFTDAGGKTGTAQESLKHPDHVLFIGYTPADNPKITVACRIAHGYTSVYPAEVGNKIFRLYNGVATEEQIIGTSSYSLSGGARAD